MVARDVEGRAGKARQLGDELSIAGEVGLGGLVFEDVAQLLVPEADPEVLAASIDAARERIASLRADAFRRSARPQLDRLSSLDASLDTSVARLVRRSIEPKSAQPTRKPLRR